MGKVASAMDSATQKIKEKVGGVESKESRTIMINVTVDMVKELGSDLVQVKIKDFQTDKKIIEKVMSNDHMRKHMEEAMSKKASEAATNMLRQQQQKIRE